MKAASRWLLILFFIPGLLRMPRVRITVYHAVEEQTDSTPFLTSDMTRIYNLSEQRLCAVSYDLQEKYGLRFGDVLHVEGMGELSGIWYFHDNMNESAIRYVDLLVDESVYTAGMADVYVIGEGQSDD